MRIHKFYVLATVATTLITHLPTLEGFGLTFGPFDLRFGEDSRPFDGDYRRREVILDNPICEAISRQQQLEFLVEGKEKVNSKEIRITTKRIIVNPYAFGFTNDRQPILRGVVIDEKLVREVTIKFGENQFPEQEVHENNPNNVRVRANESDNILVDVRNKNDEENKKFFTGLFRSHKSKESVETLNITKVSNLRILGNSHFEVPKNLKTLYSDDIAQVICQVVPSQQRNVDSQDYAATEQDKNLNETIRDQLNRELPESYNHMIEIKTTNGVVTVDGVLDNSYEIQKIGNLIKRIPGVKRVDNRLALKK